jgi:transcriptional antiterminator NusG
VTGFVGPGSRPIPLDNAEIEATLNRAAVSIDIAVGEEVRVLSGPLADHVGRVEDIDTIRQKISVVVSMFGRDVPVEVDYDQVLRV